MTTSPKRILVATDFSPNSDEALAQAITLAKDVNASLEIVHVIQLGTEPFPFGLLDFQDNDKFFQYIDRELEQRAEQARKAGVACTTKSIDGAPASTIVSRARETGAELVVVGTQGRTGLAHALLGSVAEKIVRHAACPVLTVPAAKRAA